jgi:type II secretory pathway pseudopilin PulG
MKRTCFTIIEVTVVIAIIALLIAITVPTLRSSRLQAKTVLCSSNIRQLQIGLSIYESENQTFPAGFFNNPGLKSPPGGYAGKLEYDRTGWWWFNFLEGFYKKYQGQKTVILCPSKLLNDSKLESDVLCGNYGVNHSICKSSDDRQPLREEFVGVPLSADSVTKPAKTLLILDSGYSLISWWNATSEPPVSLNSKIIEDTSYVPGLSINKKKSFWPGQEDDAINGRHPEKTVNAGFIDDHLERLKAESLLVEKEGEIYKNKSLLWQPK